MAHNYTVLVDALIDESLLNEVVRYFECAFFTTSVLLGWRENPTTTLVETTTFPIEELDFPTITLCPKSFNSDRWGPTIKILNYLSLICEER